VNLYYSEKLGDGHSYIAPDPHFISTVLLFTNSLPWVKFEKFFEAKKLVNITATEQLTLLRLLALQEILCINDEALLRWTKNQLYVFSFLQSDFKPKLPTVKLLSEFRSKFDEVGLLKPFRKQCQRLIEENENRSLSFTVDEKIESVALQSKLEVTTVVNKDKIDQKDRECTSGLSCPNCGSHNVIHLAPSQVASSLPKISFSRCRFCGNTFRESI